jgi:hypothetical protein
MKIFQSILKLIFFKFLNKFFNLIRIITVIISEQFSKKEKIKQKYFKKY